MNEFLPLDGNGDAVELRMIRDECLGLHEDARVSGEESAASGMVRFFGFWDLVDRGGKNKGSLNWKVEHRHKYTDIPVSGLGFESGYVGLIGAPFSNQEWSPNPGPAISLSPEKQHPLQDLILRNRH